MAHPNKAAKSSSIVKIDLKTTLLTNDYSSLNIINKKNKRHDITAIKTINQLRCHCPILVNVCRAGNSRAQKGWMGGGGRSKRGNIVCLSILLALKGLFLQSIPGEKSWLLEEKTYLSVFNSNFGTQKNFTRRCCWSGFIVLSKKAVKGKCTSAGRD